MAKMQTIHSQSLSKVESEKRTGAVLVLDVGTTGAKAFMFDAPEQILHGEICADEHEPVLARVSLPLQKSFPKEGWVEQDPGELLAVSKRLLTDALLSSGRDIQEVSGFGVANQRETTIVWERLTGRPIYPAIVWEDKRTKALCESLEQTHGKTIAAKTGLHVDSYFSASKIKWLLDFVPNVRVRAKKGDLCFGTVDTWLLWNLGEGYPHVTDVTNASRTLLFNIHTKEWDDELLSLFDIPRNLLPRVLPSATDFGRLSPELLGGTISIRAVAGDQQASLFAAGTDAGTTKVTFGTGIFIMQIAGENFQTHTPFFTTLTAGKEGQSRFAVEAKIESCAECVTPLIGRQTELDALLDGFTTQVAHFVGELPIRPKELVIDGGVVQAPHLKVAIERATKLSVREHAIFDGTALGIARLIRSSLM